MTQLTRRELAEFTGFATGTLSKWAKDGMPVLRDGASGSEWRADSQMVVAWMLERERSRVADSADVSEQRARLLKAQAAHAELDLAKRRGELMEGHLVEKYWGAMASAFRARCLLIPGMSAPLVRGKPPAEAEGIIRKLVYEALNELADDGVPPELRRTTTPDQ